MDCACAQSLLTLGVYIVFRDKNCHDCARMLHKCTRRMECFASANLYSFPLTVMLDGLLSPITCLLSAYTPFFFFIRRILPCTCKHLTVCEQEFENVCKRNLKPSFEMRKTIEFFNVHSTTHEKP